MKFEGTEVAVCDNLLFSNYRTSWSASNLCSEDVKEFGNSILRIFLSRLSSLNIIEGVIQRSISKIEAEIKVKSHYERYVQLLAIRCNLSVFGSRTLNLHKVRRREESACTCVRVCVCLHLIKVLVEKKFLKNCIRWHVRLICRGINRMCV